jgi:membrane associated rhomboid family serine protease
MPIFSYERINAGSNRPAMTREEERKHLWLSIFMPMVFVMIMWLVKIFEIVSGYDLSSFGIYPKHPQGLPGILFSPFIHGDWQHLLSNTLPFIVLSFLMIFNYRKVAFKSFIFIYLISGFLVWVFGRESFHIGASNLVYGFAFFIFFSGIFRKNMQSIALSLFVVFLYGSIVWGLFPIDFRISFEGHLMGAFAGTVIAFYYRKVDLPEEIQLDDEEDEGAPDDLVNTEIRETEPVQDPEKK